MFELAEEKILNMRHILSDGSTIELSQLSRQLFQPIRCVIDGHLMQTNEISRALQQAIPFLHASGIHRTKQKTISFLFFSQMEKFKSIPMDR